MITSIGTQVQRILADILSIPAEEITNDASPETIEMWDSLQHIISCSRSEEIEQLTSIQMMIDMLEEL